MASGKVFPNYPAAIASTLVEGWLEEAAQRIRPEFDPRVYGDLDGDPHAAIQAAIDAASERPTGGCVVVPSGRFPLSNTLSITASNVSLVGQGSSTVLALDSPAAGKHIVSVTGTSNAPLTGVRVSNLRIQGHGDDSGATADRHGIYVRWSDGMKLSRLWASDCTFCAIRVDDSEHAVITDITVEAGTRGATGGWYGVQVANFTKGQGPRGYSGHHVLAAVNAHVPEHAVSVYLCDDVTVTGLVSTGAQNDYAVNWTGARRVIMSDFTLSTAGGGYIYVERDDTLGTLRESADCSFMGGQCRGLVTASAVQVRDLHGVYLTNAPDTSLTNVTLDCSTQTGTTHGVEIASTSPRSRLTDVRVVGPVKSGVRVSADDVSLTRVTVSGARGNGATNGGIEASGARLAVAGCRVDAGAGNGIYAASQYGSIIDNFVTGCAIDGVVAASADMTVARNHSTGHTGVGFRSGASAARLRLLGNLAQTNTGGNFSLHASATQPSVDRFNKGLTNDVQARSSSFTVGLLDLVNVVDASAAARTVTLPAASAVPNGKQYIVKNKAGSANDVTVQRAGTDTIDGATSKTLTAGQILRLVSDGTSLWNEV
ncbi:hypothetical protein Val02_27030 [Virgisporangium aliadipatigenens]|uniref:Rhamnogalacturonase A/B/Epimerase-like pectate lyase domain-containing protein n=1 Tax=Virgisporangium aliadipatigenens TaxID=741659 RepID=A0A8J3YK88_9ACTN|nr:right-handed parallel beta-helix repeat-containing protein [Virgisporangium aliadipatigenens]GIJ45817.1 hypothetical protein Val02_27030 [Virgisporangium aliadipatigenens]